VTAARDFRPPHHPTGKQAYHRLENGSFPVQRSDQPRTPPFDIVDGRQDQTDQRNGGPDSALRARRAVHHGYQEENQGGGLRQDAGEIQPWNVANQQRQFTERGERKAAPPDKPKAEIDRVVIAAEKKKENQQDDRGSCFEESNPEQALIRQHDAPPPGRKRRRCGDRAAAKLCYGRREALSETLPDANTLFSYWARPSPFVCAVTYNAC